MRRLPERETYDLELLETMGSTPWATRGIGNAPTSDFVLPFPTPPLPSGGFARAELTTKEQARDSNPATTTANVETGGAYQEGGAT